MKLKELIQKTFTKNKQLEETFEKIGSSNPTHFSSGSVKLIIIILLSCCLLFSGCVYDKAHTIKTNSDVCGEYCFYQAKKYSCLQYSKEETTSYTNGVSNNISDNCICDLLECRK